MPKGPRSAICDHRNRPGVCKGYATLMQASVPGIIALTVLPREVTESVIASHSTSSAPPALHAIILIDLVRAKIPLPCLSTCHDALWVLHDQGSDGVGGGPGSRRACCDACWTSYRSCSATHYHRSRPGGNKRLLSLAVYLLKPLQ